MRELPESALEVSSGSAFAGLTGSTRSVVLPFVACGTSSDLAETVAFSLLALEALLPMLLDTYDIFKGLALWRVPEHRKSTPISGKCVPGRRGPRPPRRGVGASSGVLSATCSRAGSAPGQARRQILIRFGALRAGKSSIEFCKILRSRSPQFIFHSFTHLSAVCWDGGGFKVCGHGWCLGSRAAQLARSFTLAAAVAQGGAQGALTGRLVGASATLRFAPTPPEWRARRCAAVFSPTPTPSTAAFGPLRVRSPSDSSR